MKYFFQAFILTLLPLISNAARIHIFNYPTGGISIYDTFKMDFVGDKSYSGTDISVYERNGVYFVVTKQMSDDNKPMHLVHKVNPATLESESTHKFLGTSSHLKFDNALLFAHNNGFEIFNLDTLMLEPTFIAPEEYILEDVDFSIKNIDGYICLHHTQNNRATHILVNRENNEGPDFVCETLWHHKDAHAEERQAPSVLHGVDIPYVYISRFKGDLTYKILNKTAEYINLYVFQTGKKKPFKTITLYDQSNPDVFQLCMNKIKSNSKFLHLDGKLHYITSASEIKYIQGPDFIETPLKVKYDRILGRDPLFVSNTQYILGGREGRRFLNIKTPKTRPGQFYKDTCRGKTFHLNQHQLYTRFEVCRSNKTLHKVVYKKCRRAKKIYPNVQSIEPISCDRATLIGSSLVYLDVPRPNEGKLVQVDLMNPKLKKTIDLENPSKITIHEQKHDTLIDKAIHAIVIHFLDEKIPDNFQSLENRLKVLSQRFPIHLRREYFPGLFSKDERKEILEQKKGAK